MRKYFLAVSFITFVLAKLSAQSSTSDVSNYTKLIEVLPPSPNAASLGKYGGIDVGLSTGMVNKTISLFDFTSSAIKFPVSLNYSSSGFRVDEIASRTGSGWSLNAGGVITRTVYGSPDEQSQRIKIPANFPQMSRSLIDSFLQNLSSNEDYNYWDGQPDIFSFNFCGYSGKFLLDSINNPVPLNYSAIKIEKDFAVGATWHFKITTPDGVQYFFGDGSTETTNKEQAGPGCGKSYVNAVATAWYLNKIVHPNKDTVTLTYSSVGLHYVTGISQTLFKRNTTQTPAACAGYTVSAPTLNSTTCESWLQTTGVFLTEINSTAGGKVKFTYVNRSDNDDKLLSKIEQFQPDSAQPYRVFNLNYEYSYATAYTNTSSLSNSSLRYRPFLISLIERSNDSTLTKRYQFSYNDISALPPQLSYAQDDYGYFNGKNNNTLIPKPPYDTWISYFPEATANRASDPLYCAKGLLSKIIYPTGGSDSILYEGNMVYKSVAIQPNDTLISISANNTSTNTVNIVLAYGQVVHIMGSCSLAPGASEDPIHQRVSITLSRNGVVLYDYSLTIGSVLDEYLDIPSGSYSLTVSSMWQGTLGGGSLTYKPGQVTYRNMNVIVGGVRVSKVLSKDNATNTTVAKKYYYNNPSDSISSGVSIYEPRYDKYMKAYVPCASGTPTDPSNPTGFVNCSVSEFDFYSMYSNSQTNIYGYSSVPVYYRYVTESNGENFENGGVQHDFLVTPDNPGNNIYGDNIASAPFTSSDWKNGFEVHQSIFKKISGTIVPVKETFTHFKEDSRVQREFVSYVVNKKYESYCQSDPPGEEESAAWDLYSYSHFQKWVYPDTIRTLTYSPDGSIALEEETITEYENVAHAFPTKIHTFSSDNSEITVKKYYPADTVLTGTAETARQTLLTRNITSAVLDERIFKNGNLLYDLATNYKVFENNLVLPESQNVQVKSNPSEKRVEFHSYDDHGQLTEQAKTNDVINAYLYDYKDNLLIAQVINADWPSIAYTSFEADGKGGWSFNGVPVNDISAITGKKAYILNSTNNISKSGLNSTATYVVSYWTKNNSAFSIAGTLEGFPVVGANIGDWKYFEHRITGQTSITISGTGSIDELRLYPINSQMVTYTYDPLIGITSQADANSRITYYEYDGLERLLLIRDQDRNILKKYCYNYAGQTTSCLLFKSNEASQSFTRNNCGSGYQGGSATYTVPAGKYVSTISQADADAKAQAEINANGQNYANQNGTCTLIYYNVQKSGTFTRNNCASSGTGSAVTYTVPAGTYYSTQSQAAADQLAQNDVNANGQSYANSNGVCTFYNVQKSGSFTRNNCAAGGTPSTVTYTVAAGTYSSTVSQAAADQLAQNDVNSNGQAYANANGTCTFYNVVISGTFTKNNCSTYGVGSSVNYTVAAGTYSSTISQTDANALAQNDLNTNGQTYANNNGYCTWYNIQKSGTFTKNNCATGGTGSAVTYTVAADVYSSTISQAAADQLAQNDVNTNGQTYANVHGICTFYNVQKSGTFTKNNCSVGGMGSTVTYTVPAGAYSSQISQVDADQLAQNDVNNNGQTYANNNGSCTWYSVQKSGTFTRNNCPAGYTGSTVTYTVAAGTYSSTASQATADQLAQNDVNANGQSYANTNGTCTQPTIYARFEYTDYFTDYDATTATVLLRFYSDASCTIPFSVSNLTVNYQTVRTGFRPSTLSSSVTCSGTQYSFGSQTVETTGFAAFSITYNVTSGTGYVAKPTIK